MDEHTLNRLAQGTLPNGRLYPPPVEYRSRPQSRAVSQSAASQCTSSEELSFINRPQSSDEPEHEPTWEKRSDADETATWPRNYGTDHSENASMSTTHRRSRANSEIRRRSQDTLDLPSRTHTPSDTTRGHSSDDEYVHEIKHALERNMFSKIMALSKFRPWYDIIKRNDVQALENVLNNVSTQGRIHLLNVPFQNDTTLERENNTCLYTVPTFVAATFKASDVMIAMYDRGANIFNHDLEHESIIHCFCKLSQNRYENEAYYIELYERLMKQYDASTTWKTLLMGEEKDGLRPLELASKLGTFGIMKAIVETENVYKFRHVNHTFRYDFREYESWDKTGRRSESPLRFLLYVQGNDLEKPYCRELLSSGPVAKWIEKKVRDTQFYCYLWMLMRIGMVMAFVVFSAEDRKQYLHKVGLGQSCVPDEEQAEHHRKVLKTLDILLVLTTSTILMSDVIDGLVNLLCGRSKRQLYQRPSQVFKSMYVVQWAWDRTIQAIFLISMLSYQVIVFYEVKYELDEHLLRTCKTVLHTLVCFLAIFSLLQFLKLFKFMAYFAVVLHKLRATFMSFGLVAIIYYAGFTVSVYYVMGYPCHVRQFRFLSDLFNSNRLRADSLDNTEAEIALVYALFFFVGCVFIIAMGVSIIVVACKLAMSCDVETIHILTRLDMAMTIEGRIGWLVLAPCRVSARTKHGIIKA